MMHSRSCLSPSVFLSVLCLGAVVCRAEPDLLVRVKDAIGDLRVTVEHVETVQPAESNKPPFKVESWAFTCGAAKPMIRYGRYLNRPPAYDGSYPSLVNGDMGIGFGNPAVGDAFRNWYGLRVLVDGGDVLAQQTALRTEFAGDTQAGYLRFGWDLDGSNSLALSFVVPEDGHAIYVEAGLQPPACSKALAVNLACFPGGFGPSYGLPSHRVVWTARAAGEVPPGSTNCPVVPITARAGWVFYADKLVADGSLGLILLPEQQGTGQVQVSSYGQSTTLRYPAGTLSCRFALFAFDTDTDNARRAFTGMIEKETETLRRVGFSALNPEPRSP